MSYLKFGLDHLESLRIRRSVSLSTRTVAQHLLILLLATSIFPVQAELYFNPRFLADGPAAVADLSSFEKGQELPPGTYRVDIYMNGGYMTTRDVTFSAGENGHGLMPCLTRGQLVSMGLNTAAVSGINALASETCVPLTEMIKDATIRLDVGQQRLYLTIPQAFMGNQARGYIPPELWDNGINAGLLNYNFTGNNVDNAVGGSSQYAYLNLQSGVNLGAWRLRDNSTWSYTSGGSSASNENKWQHVNTWLERDITPIRSRLTLGDSYTNGDVFDGINFRGAQLASDDNMLPDSLRNFAPTVRGIASSNSTVTIRQNNSVIYQKQVPPGPFEINDLYPNSTNGDLVVTIKESDGRERTFVQPFSSVAIMQREGHLKYDVTGGKYRSNSDGEEPKFAQMTMIYGLPHDLTAYGGSQLSDDYQNGLAGMGFTLGELGSISLDMSLSSADLSTGEHKDGQSYRAQYSKSMLSTGSTLTLAAYRYSTKGYYSFQDAADLHVDDDNDDGENDRDEFDLSHNKRSRWQVSLSQSLSEGWGSVYVNGYQQDYWDDEGYERSLSVGYNTSILGITYSINYNFTSTPGSENDHQAAMNVSIPLDKWLHNAYAGYNVNTNRHGDTTQQVSLYGTALAHDNLSYSVMEGYSNHDDAGSNGTMTLDYTGSQGEVSAGYNYDPDSRQVNYGLQGGIVVHPHGVTFSQALNQDIQSIAIVRSPGVSDAIVENGTGVATDWRGYAVVPYLTPYRQTTVRLDTKSLAGDAEVETNSKDVVPTEGAVVMAGFKTHIGARLLVHLQHPGTGIPFGTTASLVDADDVTGIVDDKSDVYLSGMPQQGEILALWGKKSSEQCHAHYQLDDDDAQKSSGVKTLDLVCR